MMARLCSVCPVMLLVGEVVFCEGESIHDSLIVLSFSHDGDTAHSLHKVLEHSIGAAEQMRSAH